MSTKPLDHENNVTPEQIAELVQTLQDCQQIVGVMDTRLEHVEKELADRGELLRQLVAAVENLIAFLNDNSARITAGHATVLDVLLEHNLTTEDVAASMFEMALQAAKAQQAEDAAAQNTAENNA